MSAAHRESPAWMPPPKTPEQAAADRRHDAYRRIVRARRLLAEKGYADVFEAIEAAPRKPQP